MMSMIWTPLLHSLGFVINPTLGERCTTDTVKDTPMRMNGEYSSG
jgi:hypothetical protein